MQDVKYKYFESEVDLDLQYKFWEIITKKLIWAWKMTRAPTSFMKDTNLPKTKSRCFAFVEKELIGYMSFSGDGDFVSIGYPWLKSEWSNRDDVREELWKRVFGYASGEYGGKHFLQRFRKQWKQQIEFFLGKGFTIPYEHPIYILSLKDSVNSAAIEVENKNYRFQFSGEFDTKAFVKVVSTYRVLDEQQLKGIGEYYSRHVNFDFSLSLIKRDDLVGYFGVTIRCDTSYAEIIAIAFNQSDLTLFSTSITTITKKLKEMNGDLVSITTDDEDRFIPIIEDLGFILSSADVYVELKI